MDKKNERRDTRKRTKDTQEKKGKRRREVTSSSDEEQEDEEVEEEEEEDRSIHSRRRNPNKLHESRQGRLKFRHAASLEEVHYIVHAPPAYHYSLDGFADDDVEETWMPEELTIAELKDALHKRGLKRSGRKADLVDRLTKVIEDERLQRRQKKEIKRRKLDEILGEQQEEEPQEGTDNHEENNVDCKEEEDNGEKEAEVAGDSNGGSPNGDDKKVSEGGTNEEDAYTIKRVPPKENGHQTAPQQRRGAPASPSSSPSPKNTKEASSNGNTNNVSSKQGLFDTFFQEIKSISPKSGVQVPSSTSSPLTSPSKKPIKGVLKRREEKKPQDMKIPELKEHLLAFGISGCSGKKRSELVAMLEEAIEESKHSSVFISLS